MGLAVAEQVQPIGAVAELNRNDFDHAGIQVAPLVSTRTGATPLSKDPSRTGVERDRKRRVLSRKGPYEEVRLTERNADYATFSIKR
jgi:hypothetical protein